MDPSGRESKLSSRQIMEEDIKVRFKVRKKKKKQKYFGKWLFGAHSQSFD